MATCEPTTETLLQRADQGDRAAVDLLLRRHSTRLRQMVDVRMDSRLVSRIDPSDVVQETFAEAVRTLSKYLRERPLPFYPWLRQLAWNRMVDLHRRHIQAHRRSVHREEPLDLMLSDHSAMQLANRLIHSGTDPTRRAGREEQKVRIRAALSELPPHYREVLVLRHLEQLSPAEIATVLNTTEGAVKTRLVRALQRMRERLGNQS